MSEQQESEIAAEVRRFYDQIGWSMQSDGFYQNARYEDLRPVSQEYIHRCHLRVKRHLAASGKYLLDAGSGPIQYPEYLDYSLNYMYRVCVDLSIVALKEARKRIGNHGLFVVADVTQLPFNDEVFDGTVTLHTFHHLPLETQKSAYDEVYRTLAVDANAVVVNGWTDPWLMRVLKRPMKLAERFTNRSARKAKPEAEIVVKAEQKKPVGTFIAKMNPDWLATNIGNHIPYAIFCWRSINVRFMRAMIHEKLLGKLALKILFWKEELLPGWFGKVGQYPLIVLYKRKSTS